MDVRPGADRQPELTYRDISLLGVNLRGRRRETGEGHPRDRRTGSDIENNGLVWSWS